MFKAYRFQFYPDDVQKSLIHKTFGCYRFIYNYYLDKCKRHGFQKAFDMIKDLPSLYATYPWLKEVDSCSLRCAIFNLEDAYKNYFAKRSNYPIFKSKFKRQSYRTNCVRSSYKGKNYSSIELDLKAKEIKLPKLGNVSIRGYRNLDNINGRIINATVIYETTGKYYVSVVVEEPELIHEKVTPRSIVGVDLGIKDLVITSSGEKYDNQKALIKKEKQLKRLQRKLSRQIKTSKNYQKTKKRLARVYTKIKNTRKHNIITIVNKIADEYDIITTEKLNVQEMEKNHNLAKYITDASFYKICNMFSWKAKLKGKYYYQVDTYFPSSKMCSVCGTKTSVINDLNVREWECKNCGTHHDRDINASINIMFEGLKCCFGN